MTGMWKRGSRHHAVVIAMCLSNDYLLMDSGCSPP
jgi:hypothetical protein